MKDERRIEINERSADKRAHVIDHLVRLNASILYTLRSVCLLIRVLSEKLLHLHLYITADLGTLSVMTKHSEVK